MHSQDLCSNLGQGSIGSLACIRRTSKQRDAAIFMDFNHRPGSVMAAQSRPANESIATNANTPFCLPAKLFRSLFRPFSKDLFTFSNRFFKNTARNLKPIGGCLSRFQGVLQTDI